MERTQKPLRMTRPSTARAASPSAGVQKAARARNPRPLVAGQRFRACAWIAAERIDTKSLGHLPLVAELPLMLRLPGGGVAALFRYGAICTIAEEPGDREWLLAGIAPAISGQGDPDTREDVWVLIDRQGAEGPSGEAVRMRDGRGERLQLLAEALAKAALLSFHERRVAADVDRIEPLAQDLAEDGRFSTKSRDLLKAVGSMLLAEHRLTGSAEVMDAPELLWDHPDLEGLYARLEGYLELRERAVALERKLTTLSNTAETLVEAVRHRSSLRVEWYIVFLIVFEIALSLWEKLN